MGLHSVSVVLTDASAVEWSTEEGQCWRDQGTPTEGGSTDRLGTGKGELYMEEPFKQRLKCLKEWGKMGSSKE